MTARGRTILRPAELYAVGVSKTRNALGIVSDPAPHLDVSVFLIVVQHTLPHQGVSDRGGLQHVVPRHHTLMYRCTESLDSFI